MSTKTNIIIVDDHKMFRDGLKFLLSELKNVNILAEAENGIHFIDLLKTHEPNLVLMDIDMPHMNGVEATQKGLEILPNMKIIALTMFGDEHYYYQMIHAGARGFLLKKSGSTELVEAIDTVMNGNDFFSMELLKSIILSLGTANGSKTSNINEISLTQKETEVLEYICKGLSAKEIGSELKISPRTVEVHKSSLFEKTGTKNTSSLIMIAIKNKLVKI